MLSGTNALEVIKAFKNSRYEFNDVVLGPLREKDFGSLLRHLGGTVRTEPPHPAFVKFLAFVLSGHARLFRIFISVLSAYGATFLPDSDKLEPKPIGSEDEKANRGPHFNPSGFHQFFERGFDRQPKIWWTVLDDTDKETEKKFPEAMNNLLRKDSTCDSLLTLFFFFPLSFFFISFLCQPRSFLIANETLTVRRHLLVSLLSDTRQIISRNAHVAGTKITWGDLETWGAVILCPLYAEKGGQLPGGKRRRSKEVKLDPETKEKLVSFEYLVAPFSHTCFSFKKFEVAIPLTIATKLWQKPLNLPKEPILSFAGELSSQQNEVQDLAVLLHRLGCTGARSVLLLSQVLLPGFQTQQDLSVEVPGNTTDIEQLRTHVLEPEAFLNYVEKPVRAYVNGKTAGGADSFILLKLTVGVQGCEWVLILIQSKRKETPEARGEVDKELWDNYNKTIWRRGIEQFLDKKIFPIFLYLTDAKTFGNPFSLPFPKTFLKKEN